MTAMISTLAKTIDWDAVGPVPRVVSLLQGDRVNRWLGLLLSEPILSAREMEDPGKKKATTKKSKVVIYESGTSTAKRKNLESQT